MKTDFNVLVSTETLDATIIILKRPGGPKPGAASNLASSGGGIVATF